MPEALDGLSKEELLSYAKQLLVGAIDRLEMDMPDQAAWRICNALGALSTMLIESGSPIPGITVRTNLGYKLEIEYDHPKQVS